MARQVLSKPGLTDPLYFGEARFREGVDLTFHGVVYPCCYECEKCRAGQVRLTSEATVQCDLEGKVIVDLPLKVDRQHEICVCAGTKFSVSRTFLSMMLSTTLSTLLCIVDLNGESSFYDCFRALPKWNRVGGPRHIK